MSDQGYGLFGRQTTAADGLFGGFEMNYLNQGNGGNPIVPGADQSQNPWFADWAQLGTAGKLGVVSQGLGAFSNLANIYAGFKALSLQKKQFQFAKEAWTKNYNNQVKDYENTLKDRWAARNASAGARGGGFESMGSWVGSRSLTGEAPGYRAQSPQGFYAGNSAQENRPIRPKGAGGSGG